MADLLILIISHVSTAKFQVFGIEALPMQITDFFLCIVASRDPCIYGDVIVTQDSIALGNQRVLNMSLVDPISRSAFQVHPGEADKREYTYPSAAVREIAHGISPSLDASF